MRVVAFLVASGLFGQEFEAASVKPSTPQELDISMFTYPGGRITVRNYTLKQLIHVAWEVQDFQITGGPGWTGQDRFSMELKPPPSSESSKFSPADPKNPPPREELAMLQNLLADRFQLKLHRETREGTVYVLVAAGKSAKLEPPKDPNDRPLVMLGFDDGSGSRSYYLQGINATMKDLAARLAGFFHRPVNDETNLPGNFDFKFSYDQDETNSSLISAVRQIGLKLEARKGHMEILVIDRAEKPSAN